MWIGERKRSSLKGYSTRLVTLPSGQKVAFVPQALEQMAEQVRQGFVPLTLEHLSILPPLGVWHDAKVVRASDGAHELIMYGRYFRVLRPVGADPSPWDLVPAAEAHDGERESPSIDRVALEPRNFDPDAIRATPRFAPVKVVEERRWSELRPLEWVVYLPVIWGAMKFGDSFLEELGRGTAKGLLTWIKNLAVSAKAWWAATM